jgi:hypothetical protein
MTDVLAPKLTRAELLRRAEALVRALGDRAVDAKSISRARLTCCHPHRSVWLVIIWSRQTEDSNWPVGGVFLAARMRRIGP